MPNQPFLNTFGPIDQTLVVPVNCNSATGFWMNPAEPDVSRKPFNQFSCDVAGLACPCPLLSSLESTATVDSQVNVPLASEMTALTYDTNNCETSAMLNCAAFGKGVAPRFGLTTPTDVTVGQVNGVISKTATCLSNGNWQTTSSTGANVTITSYRCYYIPA